MRDLGVAPMAKRPRPGLIEAKPVSNETVESEKG